MYAAQWIDVGGIRTRYIDVAAGAQQEAAPRGSVPIVFLHGGFMGSWTDVFDHHVWTGAVASLAGEARCVAFDRLGQGETGNPLADNQFTMDASVRHAAAFLETLGGGPYHLVGHAEGAYVACRLAFEQPDLVRSCVIVSSAALSPGVAPNPVWSARAGVSERTRESIRRSLSQQIFVAAGADATEGAATRFPWIEEWAENAWHIACSERDCAAVGKMLDGGLARTQYAPDLRRQRIETHRWILERGVPCPTLLVWGHDDPVADPENGKLLMEMLMQRQPDTEFRLVNRAGHFVFQEQPNAFSAMLRAYFADLQ